MRTNMRRYGATVGTVAMLVFVATLSGQSQDAEKVRAALLEAVTANKAEVLRGTKVVWKTDQIIIAPDGTESPPKFVGIGEGFYSGPRWAYRIFDTEEDYEKGRFITDVRCDGSTKLGLDASTANIESAPRGLNSLDWSKHLWLLGYQSVPGPDAVLSSQTASVNPTPEQLNGYPTFLVTDEFGNGLTVKYWFAPDLSGNPVRAEVWSSKTDRLLSRADYSNFREEDNGLWLPMSAKREVYVTDVGTDVMIDSILELEVGQPVDENRFKVDLDVIPDGHMVNDTRFGQHYVKGQGPLSDAAVKQAVKQIGGEIAADLKDAGLATGSAVSTVPAGTVQAASEIPSETPPRTARIPIILAAAGAVLLLAAVIRLLTRARKPER